MPVEVKRAGPVPRLAPLSFFMAHLVAEPSLRWIMRRNYYLSPPRPVQRAALALSSYHLTQEELNAEALDI